MRVIDMQMQIGSNFQSQVKMSNLKTKSNTKELVLSLKQCDEDFEFYPTSKEMIRCIFDNIRDSHIQVLDIGCGTCNFKRFYEELSTEKYSADFEIQKHRFIKNNPGMTDYDYTGNYSGYSVTSRKIEKYYVMEKSKILLNMLDKNTIVLGTDFHNSLLIDKPVEVIFCNPPYSEFKNWMIKIISESNCHDIYLIVPERWTNDQDINAILKRKELTPTVLGNFDFLDAERSARAKVDILHINKKQRTRGSTDLDNIEQSAFDEWFDVTFQMQDSNEEEKLADYEKKENEKENLQNKLTSCEPKDKAKTLVMLYNDEQDTLFNNFKAICSMDSEVLKTIGVSKESIKEAIKQKTVHLKVLYWDAVFNEMIEITSRLTSKTRSNMLERFKELSTVEFSEANIYSLIIWVIKNANGYYDEQLIDFYKDLSSRGNIRNYKSNIKVFDKDSWRHLDNHTHYTLDYRIICSNYIMNIQSDSYDGKLRTGYDYNSKINDFKAIFHNLGFEVVYIDTPTEFGKKCYAYGRDNKTLLEFKAYKNGNLHIKFNIEFTKAMNVEVSRLLGWIRNKEDIKKEFCDEMADGAEKYFMVNKQQSLTNVSNLLIENKNDVSA